jgi:HK97 family phage major capsid protein
VSPITETTGLGQALTPEEWASYVLEHLSAQSVLIASGATVVRTTNRVVHIPRVTSDGDVGWYAELAPIGPGDPQGDELILEPHKVAALTTVSNEAVNDSSPSALDAIGTSMMRAVAMAADKAYFVGEGPSNDQPQGVMTLALPTHPGAVDYPGIVTAAGIVRGKGGAPNVLYLNPADLTGLQLATDGMDRPLIQPDPAQGMSESIAGLRLWPTPAIDAGEALVAEAAQIVVALRQDATVAVSEDYAFNTDAALVRVIARTDVGVGDVNGLCRIAAAARTREGEAPRGTRK